MRLRQMHGVSEASLAVLAYLLITLVMTWPLASGLDRDVAWDLGDSLLNMWTLAWDCTQLRRILGGDVERIGTFFHANVFYPEPFTLAYSEHLFAQAVQILPLYVATDNPILCYNVLFLSTFVLSGLGAYLFTRELTQSSRAAFVAGLLFAFAPYRFAQASHLQVVSSQWMPFVFYGIRRYFVTGHRRALAGATAAMVAQGLSSIYYLLLFTPFAVMYALWEILARSRTPRPVDTRSEGDERPRARFRLGPRSPSIRASRAVPAVGPGRWLELAAAGTVAVTVTLPFVLPYLHARERLGGGRELREVTRFSADVYGYLTAAVQHRVWGNVARPYVKLEGELFPGAVPIVLAMTAVVAWAVRASRHSREGTVGQRHRVGQTLLLVSGIYLVIAVVVVYQRRIELDLGLVALTAQNVTRLLGIAAGTFGLAALASRRVRAAAARGLRAPEAFLIAMVIAAWWLSLGPRPTVLGRPLDIAAPYGLLFDHVPGFEAIRVPARLAMIVALGLALLAGCATRAVERRRTAAVALLSVAFLAEVNVWPFMVNGMEPLRDVVTPERRVYPPRRAPAVYQTVRRLPADAVVLEFPFGHPDYDVRAMYYSTTHWRRIVNGYSGFFPPDYGQKIALLTDVLRHRDASWKALRDTGATHVIVHEKAYLGGEGQAISAWLRQSGAFEIIRDNNDVLFGLAAAP